MQPQKASHPHKLTYGSTLTNAYIQIAPILRRATAPPAPRPQNNIPVQPPGIPAPEPRVPTTPYPAQPQQIPTQIPTAREPRVVEPLPSIPAAPPPLPTHAAPPPIVPRLSPQQQLQLKQNQYHIHRYPPMPYTAPTKFLQHYPPAYYPPMPQMAAKPRKTYQPIRPIHPNLQHTYKNSSCCS